MPAGYAIRTLSADDVRAHLDAILAVAADVEGEQWSCENFLRELPGKWDLSFALWSAEGLPVAYAVLSRKERDAHIHHFMVAAGLRGEGLGAGMLCEAECRAALMKCRRLTLKVAKANIGAQRFYTGHGFGNDSREGDYLRMFKFVTLEEPR